jgi:AcrR family transcriptional regulator
MMASKNETTPKGEARMYALILAASHLLAEKGFEGLRLWEVAEQVGINHSTLHHYFPTKEALVQAIVLSLTQRLAEAATPTGGTPLDQLHSHLHALLLLTQREPELFTALNEIGLRAKRDPAIRATAELREEAWHGFLVSTLQEGIKQGIWPQDLDAQAAAFAIRAVMHSINVMPPEGAKLAIQQLERWLMGGYIKEERESSL